jgi:hypothetical protein
MSMLVVYALRALRAWVASLLIVTRVFVGEGGDAGSGEGAGNSLVLCQSKTQALRVGVQAEIESCCVDWAVLIEGKRTSWPAIPQYVLLHHQRAVHWQCRENGGNVCHMLLS